MRSIKIIFVVLISSLVLQSTAFAIEAKLNPKHKLARKVTCLLDRADYLDLKGESVETTIVLMVNDESRLVIIDTGTDIQKVDKYIRNKLSQKKIRTRKVRKNVYHYLTVRFVPRK